MADLSARGKVTEQAHTRHGPGTVFGLAWLALLP
jgi:hypothetical protein